MVVRIKMIRQIKTGLVKLAIALGIQFAAYPLIGLAAGGAVAMALLFGREIAQHEYKLAINRGWSWGPPPVKWYEGITTGWSRDSVIDFALPLSSVTAAMILVEYV